MTISAGTNLGSYEVLAQIGAGGMGEVYQAHDTKLGRDVAIKILPEAFAHDPKRLSRFQREAKMLASLNHPNIATIHGLEQSNGTSYLVMELVSGETLAERIKREGAVPIEEALAIAKQIAEALEAAHEKGVIHRDLKPANIKVTPEGKVKVLDFGLAKAFAGDTADSNPSQSPTLSAVATMQGVLLGTAAYMSPEQARGKSVDKRTDIWAFGCVLYELLTGKQAFDGEDITEILAAVVRAEPDWQALPAATPVKIHDLLRRCLQKEKTLRLQAAGDARIEIHEALTAPAAAEPVAAQRKNPLNNSRAAWSVAAIAVVVAALEWGALAYLRHPPQDAQPVRFFVSPPDTGRLAMSAPTPSGAVVGPLAVSPDGNRIAIVATRADGKSQLWVRSLDTLTAQSLAGTDGAFQPFWSPDGRFLGFFADGKLKKIEVSGGPSITLCDAPDPRSGTWNRDGVIVFGPTPTSPLQRVSAAGGLPTTATTLGQGESVHMRPFFLPDGRHFLYRASTGPGGGPIYVGSLNSAERKLLFNADSANVFYSQGYLLFLRETMLMAQPFDARRLVLTGDAFPIAENIVNTPTVNPAGVFSVSENGVLAYQTGATAAGSHLVWFDRSGKQTGALGDSLPYGDLVLSPDNKRASVNIPEAGKSRDIWLYDVTRGLRTRFTFGPANQLTSIWSPDGSRVVFNSNRKGHYDLYQKASSGVGTEEVLLEDNLEKYPLSWSPDGRFILYRTFGVTTGYDLFVLPLTGDHKPFAFLNTKFNEHYGQFSPDGRWVAYVSDESGRNEVYVAPFPGAGGKWQISTTGGLLPRWRHDGTEIFYLDPYDNKLMAAAVNGKGGSFDVGTVKPLFETYLVAGSRYAYDVSADGQRFLINTILEQTTSGPITVVLNWTAGLKK
jgi:serine/threonine protein kinase/Tol biopolymer transport system component